MSGAGASSVPQVDDQSVSNNNIPQTSETQIGVPCQDFNIHQAVLYTHGYFKKVQLEDSTTRAKCMVCWIEKSKEVLLKITDSSTKGLLI